MSFLIKHHLLHVLRHRQQRYVAEENSHCFQILLKALPNSEEEGEDESDRSSVVALDDLSVDLTKGKGNTKKKDNVIKGTVPNRDRGHRSSGRGNNGSAPTKRDPSPSLKSVETKVPCVSNGSVTGNSYNNNRLSQRNHEDSTSNYNSVDMCNGEVVCPSSAKHGQPPSGKKQALVKAVPRTDLQQQTEAREKVVNC